jgi:hypothetical protein
MSCVVSEKETECPDAQCIVSDAFVKQCDLFKPDITCPGCSSCCPDSQCADASFEEFTCPECEKVTVDTVLSKSTIAAGEEVTVTCIVKEGGKETDKYSTEIFLLLPDGKEQYLDSHKLNPFLAGKYTVSCIVKEISVIDTEPDELTVTASDVTKITTEISPSQIIAGSPADVKCIASDNYQNTLPEFGSKVEVVSGQCTVLGYTVTSTSAGKCTVRCKEEITSGIIVYQPADLTVLAGNPVKLTLSASPAKDLYGLGDAVEIKYSAVDEYGNDLAGIAIDPVSVTPSDCVSLSMGIYTFVKEGKITFSAWIKDFSYITSSLTLTVDQSGPEIKIFYPQRGAMLTGLSEIPVAGIVNDQISQTAYIQINGIPAVTSTDGSFEFIMNAETGMNILEVEAADDYGFKTRTVQSFYYSSSYYNDDPSNPDENKIKKGLFFSLGKNFFDDGIHDPDKIDDLAGALENILTDKFADIGEFLPSPLSSSPDDYYDVFLKNILSSPLSVSVLNKAQGLEITLLLKSISSDIEFKGKCGDPYICPDSAGKLNADSFKAVMKIEVKMGYTDYETAIQTEDIVFTGISINVPGITETVWIKDFIEGYFSTEQGKNKLEFIKNMTGFYIKTYFKFYITNHPFKIIPVIETDKPVTMTLFSSLENLFFEDSDLFIENNTSLAPASKINYYAPGALSLSGCIFSSNQPSPFDGKHDIEIGLSTDLINQILFRAWQSGNFEGKLKSTFITPDKYSGQGITGFKADVSFMLPPLYNICPSDKIFLDAGDILIKASFKYYGKDAEYEAYASVRSSAALILSSVNSVQSVCVHVNSVDKIWLQTISANQNINPFKNLIEQFVKVWFFSDMFSQINGNGELCIPFSMNLKTLGIDFLTEKNIKIKIDEIKTNNDAVTGVHGSLFAE